jgi:outer membrane cobalamin receptor
MSSVDHIEVVRGPSSALYGANAYLGVVNIITKEGDKERWGQVLARGGSTLLDPSLKQTNSMYAGSCS